MINSILHATTIESEVSTVQADVVPLRDFLDELETMYLPPADGTLAFRWRCAPDLPVVKTDKAKLKYIVQNLINNAIKFTSEGEVSVSAEVLDNAALAAGDQALTNGQVWLKFAVTDTGVGIAEEFLPMIFEKFSQVDSSTKRSHTGIGLGLYIVKRCTELLKGSIDVTSRPGEGSTFTVRVPCSIAAEGRVSEEDLEKIIA